MNPFASKLRALRLDHGLRQSDLAERIGYEQSYLSSLELGLKGPPTQEFLNNLTRVLELSQDERAELDRAVMASQRRISIPSEASEEVYWLCHNLQQQLNHLHPVQISLIKTALNLPNEMHLPKYVDQMRMKRRSHRKIQEAQM